MAKKTSKNEKALTKAVNAAAKSKNISKDEAKFIKDLQVAAKKDGKVTSQELKQINKEIVRQKDKNKTVEAYKTRGVNQAGQGADAYLAWRTNSKNYSKPVIPIPNTSSPAVNAAAPAPPSDPPPSLPRQSVPSQVKIPSKDVINFTDLDYQDPTSLFNQFISDFGGIELSVLNNYKNIDGQNTSYAPIKRLQDVDAEYNPMLAVQLSSSPQNYSIELYAYLPTINAETGEVGHNVAVDSDGSVVITLNQVPNAFIIEAEIATSSTENALSEGI